MSTHTHTETHIHTYIHLWKHSKSDKANSCLHKEELRGPRNNNVRKDLLTILCIF